MNTDGHRFDFFRLDIQPFWGDFLRECVGGGDGMDEMDGVDSFPVGGCWFWVEGPRGSKNMTSPPRHRGTESLAFSVPLCLCGPSFQTF